MTTKPEAEIGHEKFLAKLENALLKRELENIQTAYLFAKYGHRGQQRHNGVRYFEHPRAVAEIVIKELRLKNDWRIIVLALLHDILEDSWLLTEYRLERNFGRKVALWVKLLTKQPKDGYHERLKQAPWQVLLIKLCDRLHNLRTLEHCDEAKQRKQVLETCELYLPLADILIARLPKRSRWRGKYLKENIASICAHFESRLKITDTGCPKEDELAERARSASSGS